jgi:hypothetical protein
VIVWDFASRRQMYNLFGLKQRVSYLAFSPDERFLAGAGADKMLFVWDMEVHTGRGIRYALDAQPPTFWGLSPRVRAAREPLVHAVVVALVLMLICGGGCCCWWWWCRGQTGEQVHGKGQTAAVSFLAWGAVETAGRRSKYTLCYGVGRDVRAQFIVVDAFVTARRCRC